MSKKIIQQLQKLSLKEIKQVHAECTKLIDNHTENKLAKEFFDDVCSELDQDSEILYLFQAHFNQFPDKWIPYKYYYIDDNYNHHVDVYYTKLFDEKFYSTENSDWWTNGGINNDEITENFRLLKKYVSQVYSDKFKDIADEICKRLELEKYRQIYEQLEKCIKFLQMENISNCQEFVDLGKGDEP